MTARRAWTLLAAAGLAAWACRVTHRSPTGPADELLAAAKVGDAGRVRQLLEADPGLARAGWEGAPLGPVRAAVAGGHVEVVRILLDAGADPRERDGRAQTPLFEARSPEVVGLLLERGSPVDVRSYDGETPLMARAGVPDVAERLLEAGARPDLRDAEGRTALHHAVNTSGQEALLAIATLCAYGADPRVRDEKGESAADLARRFAAEGLGGRVQGRAEAEFLAPTGGCEALRARPAAGPRATKEERSAAAHAALCQAGDAWACGRIGHAYENGEGVPKDSSRAAGFYRQSCDGGRAWGCYALAYLYRDGEGVPRDDARAAALFRQACDGGQDESCSQPAWHLDLGRGVPRDAAQAARLFERACLRAEAWSCWRLAKAYETGRGVARDPGRAAELRLQAYRAGERRACGRT